MSQCKAASASNERKSALKMQKQTGKDGDKTARTSRAAEGSGGKDRGENHANQT